MVAASSLLRTPSTFARIVERRAALSLLIAALRIPALLTAAELTPALHHAEKLIELRMRNAQLFGDDIQHLAFIRVQRAVGERRLNLNFQKHPNQIEAAKTDTAELLQRLTQRELALFPLAERLLRRSALRRAAAGDP